MSALAERPRDVKVEARGQKPADVEARGQRPADAEAGGQKPADAESQRSEGQRGPEFKSRHHR